MTQAMPRDPYDIVIVGGGLTGVMMAIALSYAVPRRADRHVIALIDRDGANTGKPLDLRTTTIHAAGKTMLQTLGVWERLRRSPTAIHQIKIAAGIAANQSLSRRQQRDFQIGWQDHNSPMAYVVSNDDLQQALYAVLAERPVTMINHASVIGLLRPGTSGSGGLAVLQIDDHDDLACHLIVACDGANSQLRTLAGMRRRAESHRQTAIVANLAIERDHDHTAFQRFLPTGPLAFMPHGDKKMSMVWSLPKAEAETLMDCDDGTFSAQVYQHFGDHLGNIRLLGSRWLWPLIPAMMPKLTDPYLVLAGDAGHVIHPLAGQGYNLALGDAAVLADAVAAAARLGLPPSHRAVRTDYEAGRKVEVTSMSLMTSGLNRLMSADSQLARLAGSGMQLVDTSPLKTIFQKSASGGHLTDAALLRGKLPG